MLPLMMIPFDLAIVKDTMKRVQRIGNYIDSTSKRTLWEWRSFLQAVAPPEVVADSMKRLLSQIARARVHGWVVWWLVGTSGQEYTRALGVHLNFS